MLVKDGVHNGRSAVRRVNDVDPAVAGLNGIGICEGIVAAGNIAPIGIGLVVVGRDSHGQRGAIVHVIVVNKQEMAVLQLDEVNGGVGV